MSVELLCTTRNGVVERLERGHAVVCDVEGRVVWAAGDREHVTYLRSSSKPVQATALITSGAVERYGLQAAHLSVACGSHHGEERHVTTVRDMLSRAGVPPETLGCGTHDLDGEEMARLATLGLRPTPLHNNCSGKHAGMLAAANALGAPLDSYLQPDHPVQEAIVDALAVCAAVPRESILVGIDGCSAPNFALPMQAIARCFARLGAPRQLPNRLGAAVTQITDAMRADPWLVSGTTGFDTALMRQGYGLISKAGAEGLQCVAVPSLGLGIAVKFESGRPQSIGSVMLRILEELGVFGGQPPAALAPFYCPPIRNHRGIHVGDTQVLFDPTTLSARTAASARR